MKNNGTHLNASSPGNLNGSAGNDDADWTALRYVLGEMTADEQEAFERLLPIDPQACERVASAARLATDVYGAVAGDRASAPVKRAQDSAPVRPVRSGLWAVVGLAAAVCVLVAGGLALLPVIHSGDGATAERTETSAGSLVAIWTEQSAEMAEDSPTIASAGMDQLNADNPSALSEDADDPADDSVLVADDDYDVPGWMIAAVENGRSFRPDSPGTGVWEN